MKRLILIVLCLMLIPLPVLAEGWTPMQKQANQVADIARSMGLPEDNPIIAEASRIWWEEQVRLTREAEERAEAEAQLQSFLDEHYADAVDMAVVMYAEARGLDKREQSMGGMVHTEPAGQRTIRIHAEQCHLEDSYE